MRWSELGPDALQVTARQLYDALQRTSRAVKAALLDQAVVAGLGNIYVDEVLFRCGVHPETPANRLDAAMCKAVVQQSQRVLKGAVKAGGSTLRDFVDGHGTEGRFQNSHQVYGRATLPCVTCRTSLVAVQVGGRTTVYCPACQIRG
jgi:formamidopyrimidine-DNA glycosylase